MASPIRKFRLRLKCRDHADYAARFAKRFADEFFIPTNKPLPIGAAVEVHLVFADGVVGIHGKSVVVRAGEQRGSKGLVLRFANQHTRKTTPLVAMTNAERISDFDEETPTRQSPLSKEMAYALKEEPEDPEIVIENRSLTAEPTPAAPPITPSGAETDFGDCMSDANAFQLAGLPVAAEPSAPEATNTDPSAPPLIEVAKPAEQAQVAAGTSSNIKWWLAASLLAVIGSVAVIVLQSENAAPASEEAVERPTEPSPDEVAAKELDARIKAAISTADKRVASGRLTGPDSALEKLLAAKELAPGHASVQTRLIALADKFEELATSARQANNLAEAATHLQAALLADPSRAELATRMQEIEDQVRELQENELDSD